LFAGANSEENDDLRRSLFMHYLLRSLRVEVDREKGEATPAEVAAGVRHLLDKHHSDLLILDREQRPCLVGVAPETARFFSKVPARFERDRELPKEIVNSIGMKLRLIRPAPSGWVHPKARRDAGARDAS